MDDERGLAFVLGRETPHQFWLAVMLWGAARTALTAGVRAALPDGIRSRSYPADGDAVR
jgi:hypothetical protein